MCYCRKSETVSVHHFVVDNEGQKTFMCVTLLGLHHRERWAVFVTSLPNLQFLSPQVLTQSVLYKNKHVV